MKLSKGIQNFWLQLGQYILFAIVVSLLNTWLLGISAGLMTALTTGVGLILLLAYIKFLLVKALPKEWKYKTHVAPDFVSLDSDQPWLTEQISALEELGFERLVDFQLEGASTPGLAKLFIHPQQYCLAEVAQMKAKSGEKIVQTVISSIFDQEWAVSSINRAPLSVEGISYIWRHPRKLRLFFPNLLLAEMFENHLRFRQKMLTDLNITLSTELSWNAYQEAQQCYLSHMKRSLLRKPLLLAMLEATQFELNPKFEWLGEYKNFCR